MNTTARQLVGSAAPLVSCIMPTCNRRRLISNAIECFLRQDYTDRELLIIDDGTDPIRDLVPRDARIRYVRLTRKTALGTKRNLACQRARGSIIVHWDDDDWSAPWRLSYQVGELQASGAEVCGLTRLLYWDERAAQAWWYEYPGSEPWLSGNSLCYLRRRWQQTPFPALSIGEDAVFLRARPEGIKSLSNHDFLIARVHDSNTAPKRIDDRAFTPCPVQLVSERIARAKDVSGAAQPLVSCIMPTYDRRRFIPLALHYFARQTYPNRELVVVDDGRDAIRDLLPGVPSVRYLRLNQRTPLGEKRNLAVEHARGQVIVHWDDDDWYAPERIERQVAPIIEGRAEVTGLRMPFALELSGPRLWRCSPELQARMHTDALWPGTLAYARALWPTTRYPPIQLREDWSFLHGLPESARVSLLEDQGLAVAVRHGANTWTIRETFAHHPELWERASGAQLLGADWAHYEALSSQASLADPERRPRRIPNRSRIERSSLRTPFARGGTARNVWPETSLVLNLRRSRERRAHVQRELDAHWNGPTQMLEAFDGAALDVALLRRLQLVRELDWLADGLSGGEIGCWLSHLNALAAVCSQGVRAAMILEDDVCLAPNIEPELRARLLQLSRARPSIDMVFLGCYEGYGWWAPQRPRVLLPGGFFQLGRDSRGCPGAYAYVVTAQGARRLVQKLLSGPIDQPIDQVYREQSECGLQVFCATPPMATVSGHASDIKAAAGGHQDAAQTERFVELLARARAGGAERRHETAQVLTENEQRFP